MADGYTGDVSRPSALPNANFLQRFNTKDAAAEQNSTEYLDAIEEEWNKKVDTEVGTLVDNMVELVGLASVNRYFVRGASPISPVYPLGCQQR